MNKQKAIFGGYRLIFLTGIFLLFFCGIGRDDISLKRYYEFSKDSVFNCIGELYGVKGNFIQSCVLIESKFLLSSAHGFYIESKNLINDSITVLDKKYPIKRPASMSLANESFFYFKFNNKVFFAKRIIIHPGYNDDFHSEGYNDIAIVELTEPVTFVKPAALYTDTMEQNTRGIICGYGNTIKTSGGNIFGLNRRKKMAGENMIDSLGGNWINNSWGILFADMDNPKTADCNRIGDSIPLPLEWHGDAGDCGGGLFILHNDQWRLAGISFAPSYYADWKIYGQKYGYYGFIDGWTRISPLIDWIQSNIDNLNLD
ncbi:MAG: trypsin-like serine protease [Bacteroidia bacterium]|nr:trypsin-like serine protease [Bacteroidia bacterium]